MIISFFFPIVLRIGTTLLIWLTSKEFVESNDFIEHIGLILTIALLLGAFALSCVTVVAAIIFALFIISKRNKLINMIKNRGFGRGIFIYTVWIACICAITLFFDTNFRNNGSGTLIFGTLFIGFIGLFILPIVNSNAKKAAPFILFMLTIGILLLKINVVSSNNDNSNSSGGDTSTLNTDTAVAGAATAVSAANIDNANINTADTSNIFDNTATVASAVNMDTNLNPTMTTDNNVAYNNYTTSTADTDFNTPETKTTTFYQYIDGSNNFNVNMQQDGNGTITSDDNQPMGTIEQKGNTTVIKDENGNVISTKDNINGFVYDDKGMPQGIVDNNKSVNTYYDINSGNNTIEVDGHVVDSEGHQATIKKK